jgi:hypothetical protein
LDRPVEAFELYQKVAIEKLAEGAPDAFFSAQEAARLELKEVEGTIAYVLIQVSGEGAEEAGVFIDDHEISRALLGVKAPVNPGAHQISARVKGEVVATAGVALAAGGEDTVQLVVGAGPAEGEKVEPRGTPEAQSKSRAPAYVSLGLGAAGIVFGGVFTGVHFSKQGKAASTFDDANCEVGCSDQERAAVEKLDKQAASSGTMALIGYGVGAAGLATGIMLLLLDSPGDAETARAHIRPYWGVNQAGLTGSF